MEDPIKKCDRMLRYWQRRRDELTVNATVNVNAVNAKEEGKGKENASPTPPIREKGKGEESSLSPACARPPVFDIHNMPSLDVFMSYIKYYNYTDVDWCLKWYEANSQQFQWSAANGEKLRNWTRYFNRTYTEEHAKKSCGGYRGGSVHADNWRPTPKEDVENVF